VIDHFFVLDAFLSTGNIVGVVRITWEKKGVTIFTVVTNFNITVLEVPKLQKTVLPSHYVTWRSPYGLLWNKKDPKSKSTWTETQSRQNYDV